MINYSALKRLAQRQAFFVLVPCSHREAGCRGAPYLIFRKHGHCSKLTNGFSRSVRSGSRSVRRAVYRQKALRTMREKASGNGVRQPFFARHFPMRIECLSHLPAIKKEPAKCRLFFVRGGRAVIPAPPSGSESGRLPSRAAYTRRWQGPGCSASAR